MLKNCKKILEKRRKEIIKDGRDIELASAYQEVLGDLIDHTDPCTGELN